MPDKKQWQLLLHGGHLIQIQKPTKLMPESWRKQPDTLFFGLSRLNGHAVMVKLLKSCSYLVNQNVLVVSKEV